MRPTQIRLTVALVAVLLAALTSAPSIRGAEGDQAFIVKCTRPCAAVVATAVLSGGEVTATYDNIDAVAVRVPASAVPALTAAAGADALRKDVLVAAPRPSVIDVTAQVASTAPIGAGVLAAARAAQPANYNYNLTFTNVAPLHAGGQLGQNVIVAVIDSGTTPAVSPLGSRVLGGETFVPPSEDTLPATHRENGFHGTGTADMVAANGAFLFANTNNIVIALNTYAPGSAIDCTTLPPGTCPPGFSVVPMTGLAPASNVYAMKVFPASGGGAPESRIIEAMDRSITLRKHYNAAGSNVIASGSGTETDPYIYSALKIDVVNMSLGGPTLYAGRDIEDQLTIEMVNAGLTLVTSAGNDGFGAMTVGSPGTGAGSLTVGAANTAVHERVLRYLQYGPAVGALYRASDHTQTAYFSSRGPDADGRNDPDIVANGFASYVNAFAAVTAAGAVADCREPAAVPGTCASRILFVSGTSFSSPTVAGAAAVLRGAHPTKKAVQIRNALHESANPNALGDDSTSIDQGNGLVDVAAANQLLATGHVSTKLPDVDSRGRHHDHGADELGSGGSSVLRSVEKAGFKVVTFRGNRYSTTVSNLKPGEVAQIFVPSDFLTKQFTVTIDDVSAALPPASQNQLFGDDIFFMMIDAPTSVAVERASGFVGAGTSSVSEIADPQTGLVRVALQGDWTNAGNVSARVTIERTRRFEGLPTSAGIIEQDETDFVEVDVPAGTAEAVFEVSWLQSWARYPTNDIDMILIDPLGNQIVDGATVNSPERVTIDNPTPGRWTIAIIGFTIHGTRGHEDHVSHGPQKDLYTFRTEADGRRLKQRR